MVEKLRPRLLVTGFGPFPGAPANPTEALVRALAQEPGDMFGAAALKAVVLPTDYRRSWAALLRIYARFDPDLVVHFGLSQRAREIRIETIAQNAVDVTKADIGGSAPSARHVRRRGPQMIGSTFPADAILSALADAGIAAALSKDAGGYVCNATLYRSLHAAGSGRRVGFIHVPPESVLKAAALEAAASVILRAAISA